MPHLRLVGPAEVVGRLAGLLRGDPYVYGATVQRAADGEEVVQCLVLTGAANELLHRLRAEGIEESGSLTVEPVVMAASRPVAAAARRLRGPLAEAPVWELVEARIRAGGTYRISFYLLLLAAGIIGAVGILTNSQILVVGGMVIGPEYGAIAAVALGLDRRTADPVRRGLGALLVGFVLAIVATYLFALCVRVLDETPAAYDKGLRPVSHLVGTPNFFSLVVAVVAGVVGVVSLALARTSALFGVFISATTIPAAADAGVAWAYDSWAEGLASAGPVTVRAEDRFGVSVQGFLNSGNPVPSYGC
jgi:uncharacterized hydrophobic protein (TIGR00271 family)